MKPETWEKENKAVLIATIKLLTRYIWQKFIRRLDISHEEAVTQYPPYWIDKAKYLMERKNSSIFKKKKFKLQSKWGVYE